MRFLRFQFNKNVSHEILPEATEKSRKHKRWLKLSHVLGAESSHQMIPYKFPLEVEHEHLLSNSNVHVSLNVVGRVVLSKEANNLISQHIRKSMKFAIEVMIEDEHMIGFAKADELLHVERKRIRAVVPLMKFNNSLLMKNCNYQSVFYKKKSILKAKKSKKDFDKKSIKLSISEVPDDDEIKVVPYLGVNDNQAFLIVEWELESALNEEVYEDSHAPLLTDNSLPKFKKLEVPRQEKFEMLNGKFQSVIKNVFKVYENESDVKKIIAKMMKDGYFAAIEDFLLPDICEIGSDKLSKTDDFDEFKSDYQCELASQMLHLSSLKKLNSQQYLIAQIYTFFGMEKDANEIFLRLINEESSDINWIKYAVHNLRTGKFSKALICTDEAINQNSVSILGHILKIYISFKIQKYSECERLIQFMNHEHGQLTELSMIQHFVSRKLNPKDPSSPQTITNQLKAHPEIQEIYESPEALWSVVIDGDELLNWQSPLIKSATFFIKLGCFDFAELALDEYYTTYGANVNFSYLLAVIDAIKGDYRNSLIHLKKISEHDIDNHHYRKIASLKALMLMKVGNLKTAEKLYNEDDFSGELKSENFLLKLMFGKHYNENGEEIKAFDFLKRAHKILPTKLTTIEIGKCYQMFNKPSSAAKCYHQAINFDPKLSGKWNQLYKIYLKQNRIELAYLCKQNSNCNV